ncbi:MAG: azurin/lysophospholipase L1-like esterase [Rhodothermales bacterium]|jgi:azurin/lysophospholipase L1-like esterase
MPRLLLATLALVLGAVQATAEFAFQKGDKIAIIGSGLADRMQHDGWLETLLQSANPGKDLVFRNLGFTGDTVTHRKRNKGFSSPEAHLELCKADVIFVMFGYNESFSNKPDDYKKQLVDMSRKYQALKPNGKSAPRIVLFSPIAHENLRDPNFPSGASNNVRLKAYAAATAAAAEEVGGTYVDLFTPSQARYAKAAKPLTINGIHLNAEGNRHIAEIAAESLVGKPVNSSTVSALRDSVVDKNWHWFNRYRATDGNDIWGGRSGLKFYEGQNNAVVLKHELVMFDVMTANRDKQVWARAKGSDLEVDDSNVPAPVEVISNVGGGSKSSNAGKEGNLKYQSGQDAIKDMTLKPGFQVKLFADESMFPELVNPVHMNVDAAGRIWVCAWKTYPKWEPLKEMDDRILILPDENRDGVADKAITFAKVHNPLGMVFWNGGILVSSQPEIVFLKDTDGDDIADYRISWLQGIGSADTHHAANQLTMGPDGALYWQSGVFLHNAFESPWKAAVIAGNSAMYRLDLTRYAPSFHANNSPNPHGISFDYWGYHFANDGTGGRSYQVRPEGKGFKMHSLLKKQVRPVPDNAVISSSHFPDDMQGDFLVANTIGFLGVKHYDLARDGKTGVVQGTPSEIKKGDSNSNNLISSTDKNFRPIDMVFGDDGALYLADWHNVIIGHMQHNIRDPNRDHKYGRIYQITATDRPLQASTKIAGQPIPALLKVLEHKVNGVRERARAELSKHDSMAVLGATKTWMAQFDATKKEDAHHLLEALWLHQRLNVRDDALLQAVLSSPEPHAVIAAKTVQHLWGPADPTAGSAAVPKEQEHKTAGKSGVLKETAALTEVRIGTLREKLRFNIDKFEVKAGAKIKLTFVNTDFLPHNVVFVQPGAADTVAAAAMTLGAAGFAKGFVPDSKQIIAATKLVDGDKEEVIEFTAPSKPGAYPFVCTFPGHAQIMRGIMTVK